jgi:pimeloyl-ACP methyl ester carboxylesterase
MTADQGYSTDGFDRTVARVDGIDTVIYAIGNGPPVVYFHGGGTFHGFEWARDWGPGFRVILPHHPNFGESGDADFASIDDYAAHYARLFAAIGLDRFHLVGASMGGMLAAEYAALDPASIDRLVLVSPAGLISEAVAMPDFAKVEPAALPAMFVRDPAFIAPFWPTEPSPEWQALRMREAIAAARTREDPAGADGRLRAELRGLTTPTLLLWGEGDRILPVPLIDEWKHALPHAESAVIASGGHLLLDESLPARQRAHDFLKAAA